MPRAFKALIWLSDSSTVTFFDEAVAAAAAGFVTEGDWATACGSELWLVLPCSPFFLLTEMPRWVSLSIVAFRFGAAGGVVSSPRSITSAASFLGWAGVVSFVIRISVGSFSDSGEVSDVACTDPETTVVVVGFG